VNGQKVHMVEGEVTTLATAGGGIVKLERLGDQNGHKIVVIDIIKMGLV
jgi:wobble nucleotide-excising tRNase